jgi:hypothetical protein
VRQPRTAFIREFLVVKSHVGEKPEALEGSAILELLRVTDQDLAISGLAFEIFTPPRDRCQYRGILRPTRRNRKTI